MDVTFRFNPDADDVEIVAGDKVVDTVGSDVFASWVSAYNAKHGYVQRVEVPETGNTTQEPVAEEKAEEEAVEETTEEVAGSDKE